MPGELNIIVVALGSAGDVHPNIGLALELKRRRHRVLLVAPVVFQALAERVGLEFEGLGREEGFYQAVHDPDLWHPFRSFRLVAKRLILPNMRPVYELIARRNEHGRTIVTAPSTAFGARLAQERLGIPLVTIHLQPSLMRSVVDPACYGFPHILGLLPKVLRSPYYRAVDRWLIDPLLVDEVNALRRELGLPSQRRLFGDWMHSPRRVVGLFPAWFAPPPLDWPHQVSLTGFPLWDGGAVREPRPELEAFLASGAPPLVFTAGSAMAQAKQFFEVSVQVCREAGWRGLLLTQFPEQVPVDLPKGVRHFDYVPFSEVLRRTSALVHHGGIGTSAQALASGVPQLIMPMAHDQPDNALRVKRLGVGDFLLPKQYKAAQVRGLLERVMNSSEIAGRCLYWASKMAEQTALPRTCELVEEMVEKVWRE